MGRLTTHVLDTTRGRPANGIAIELQKQEATQWRTVVRTSTNPEGRCDAPLLSGESFAAGTYQLLFHVGDYFRGRDGATESFLDVVPIRFGLAADGGHYHVPLVVSPWSYSTYRGS